MFLSSRSPSLAHSSQQSSGRGGAGNIRRASKDVASPTAPLSPTFDPDDNPAVTRGREPTVAPDKVLSTGRGGAGNIQSNSMIARAVSRVKPESHPQTASLLADAAEAAAEYERSVLRAREEAAKAGKHSSGRGGAGNYAKSKSKSKSKSNSRRSQSRDGQSHSRLRSQSRGPLHSVGRGGAGNLYPGSPEEAEYIDELDNEEAERARATHSDGIHSTGRGGIANITALSPHSPDPPELVSHEAHGHVEHTGRGGAGNIFGSRSRSASKEPRPHPAHGLGSIWKRVRSRSRAPKTPSKERANAHPDSIDAVMGIRAGTPAADDDGRRFSEASAAPSTSTFDGADSAKTAVEGASHEPGGDE